MMLEMAPSMSACGKSLICIQKLTRSFLLLLYLAGTSEATSVENEAKAKS